MALSGPIYCDIQVLMKKDVNAAGACLQNVYLGENGQVKQIEVVEVDWVNENGKMTMVEKPETTRIVECRSGFAGHGICTLHP